MGSVQVTEKNFEIEVLRPTMPVLVDFWAEWCGPCRMLGPVVEEIANEMAGSLKVVKINVDEAQELAAKHNVMSIPTLMLFKNSKIVAQMVGALPKASIMAKIKPFIS
jgi:thioredoxin 1